MLYLAVHTVEAVTAKVPLSMIMLLDHLKKKSFPTELRLRLVFPTSGLQSISIWDAPDEDLLKTWLLDNLGADCETEVSEIQEDFMFGYMMELSRLRTADKVAQNSQKTFEVVGEKTAQAAEYVGGATLRAVSAAQQKLEELDTRTGVLTAAKSTTTAAITKVRTAGNQALQSEAVNNVVQNVGAVAATSWKKVGASLSWVGERLKGQETYGKNDENAPMSDPARYGWVRTNPLYGNQLDGDKAHAPSQTPQTPSDDVKHQQKAASDVLTDRDQQNGKEPNRAFTIDDHLDVE